MKTEITVKITPLLFNQMKITFNIRAMSL